MADWSDIGASYAEAIQNFVPLHRAILFASGFTISLLIEKKPNTAAFTSLSEIKISDFASFSSAFFSDATGFNVIAGIITVFLSITLTTALARFSYFVITKSTKAEQKAIALDRSWVSKIKIEERKNALEIIEKSLEEAKIRIKNLAIFTELSAGLFVVFFISFFYSGLLDLFVSFILFFLAIILQGNVMYYFFRDYYGPALTKAHLQGKRIPSYP